MRRLRRWWHCRCLTAQLWLAVLPLAAVILIF